MASHKKVGLAANKYLTFSRRLARGDAELLIDTILEVDFGQLTYSLENTTLITEYFWR